jgi:hypothetical protein
MNCTSLSSFSVPAALEQMVGTALTGSSVTSISVAEGNCHFRANGDFLLDFEGSSITRYFGEAHEVLIGKNIKRLGAGCFAGCIGVGKLTFKSGSQLSHIEGEAFLGAESLSSLCLPSGFEELAPGALTDSNMRQMSVAEENRQLKVAGDFLLDFEGISIKLYFGGGSEVVVPKTIKRLDVACFANSRPFSKLAFESGSRVARLEAMACYRCSALKSICIPSSVQAIGAHCFNTCDSLSIVTFQSVSRVSSIEFSAFFRCPLSVISIPSSVATLCENCFMGCGSLSSVHFENGSKLPCIKRSAFEGCRSLSEIVLPASVKEIVISITVCNSRYWNSNLVPSSRRSASLPFSLARRCASFAFLSQLSGFLIRVSIIVGLFRQSYFQAFLYRTTRVYSLLLTFIN